MDLIQQYTRRTMNKLLNKASGTMDGYDVVGNADFIFAGGQRVRYPRYRVYRFETNEISGNVHVKVYKFGYPDYKSMIKKHPELK